MYEGYFIEVDDFRKIGKIVDYNEKVTSVEFFTSILKREVVKFETLVLSRKYLSPQTRVYYFSTHDNKWRMGRVISLFREADGTATYEVRFPNMDDVELSERDLYTKCFGTVSDPCDVLAIGGAETQLWHDARWSTLEALVSLRSATSGLTGLTSASIELVPHQVDAVRRVLTDPLQRYLLADEVGLGKTVEAGAIIRQVLLDNPDHKVLVAVPNSLLQQWQGELLSKFGFETNGSLKLVNHDALSCFEGYIDLLVIDEAHRIVQGNPTYDAVSKLSKTSHRLLLLSATPLVGNEHIFLDLLRWLDPDRWESESLANFKEHVSQSQEYGRLLLGLRSDASDFILKQRISGVKRSFPDDLTANDLADQLLNNLGVQEERERICSVLREYVADTYRIHHRIIRARRSDLEGWEFQPRGPATVREEFDDGQKVNEATDLIEEWRRSALVALSDNPKLENSLIDRYILLVEAVGRGVASLSILQYFEPLFSIEPEIISSLLACAIPDSDSSRAKLMALIAQRQIRILQNTKSKPKLVVFVSDTSFATVLVDTLIAEMGSNAIVFPPHNFESNSLERFERESQAVITVLDKRGEEGINLHFADAIMHADLPISIGRLEQRIGRLDRFGRTKGPIKHILVVPEGGENTPWNVWIELLTSGIEIFDQSVSDLQPVMDTVQKRVRRHLFVNGAYGIEEFVNSLKELISTERQRLDEQYALDQLTMSHEPAKVLVESIEDAESDENQLAVEIERLLRLLQFDIWKTNNELKLNWMRNVLLPDQPWRSEFDPALKRPLTWKRRVATKLPHVDLLRPGAPLINALERLLEWDDRGCSFATWRFQSGLGGIGEERLCFRLCWTISPGLIAMSGQQRAEDAQSLRRRVESLFSSWTLVQHVGADLLEIQSNEVLEMLERPFIPKKENHAQDFNLSHRQAWLHYVIGESEFADLCRRIRNHGKRMLEGSEEYIHRLSNAVATAKFDLEKRRQRWKTRLVMGDLSATREIEFDLEALRSVESPEIRLDSVGVIVLAGYIPEGDKR